MRTLKDAAHLPLVLLGRCFGDAGRHDGAANSHRSLYGMQTQTSSNLQTLTRTQHLTAEEQNTLVVEVQR